MKWRQMKRKNPQTFRQNLGIWLLDRIPHPEIDCFGPDGGVNACLVPSARGYVCRRHIGNQMRTYESVLLDRGIPLPSEPRGL